MEVGGAPGALLGRSGKPRRAVPGICPRCHGGGVRSHIYIYIYVCVCVRVCVCVCVTVELAWRQHVNIMATPQNGNSTTLAR